jgi:glycosyltransferase involved in cell wall biosynthesis
MRVKLCFNMIVKDEMANIERCLSSIADHIDCWVIGDTGSTDGTQDFITSFFAARSLPGELHSFPFLNFEQARNGALDCAYASSVGYDYLLLADADLELMVEDRDFRERLEAPGYRLNQITESALSYWNTRLVRRNAGARYHGVTHEYIDVPGGVKELTGVWYKDYACGSNRVGKFERDIRLLLEALKQDPENHRYWYYLAQSYRDAGQTAKAAETYAKRAGMGGWDEEAWNARLQEARCLLKLGDDAGFLREALAAFNQRPQRAESLYDLARFYREWGMNDTSVLFSEAGLALPRPEQDVLFLEGFVYTAGLQEEYSIAANYARDPVRKDRGFAACNWLALNRKVPDGSRDLAWLNLFYYLQPARMMMPSFAARPVGFVAPHGYRPSNPSVTRLGDQIVLAQKTVNYTLTEVGLQYQTPGGVPIHTRNFLLRLTDDLDTQSAVEILPPSDMPEPSYKLVMGFEDLRLFALRSELWGCACVRELMAEGWCEQVLARIDDSGHGPCRLTDWRVLHPVAPRQHEKNWMPQVVGERLQFIYLCDPTRVLDERARTIMESEPAINAKLFRGGSQAIAFDGGWLALIHEVRWSPSQNRRFYHHRFVWFDEASKLRALSRPFFFHKKGIEFAAGLAWHPDGQRLLVSYGVADSEAWIATVDASEVRGVLEDVERLPSGSTNPRHDGVPKRSSGIREALDSP